ncbi:MAG: hypothetical protein N3E46_08875 [Gemmataceae bacterium]|uniref:GH10 domain-containing protein n=1 Tax=Thermogemmata fonticola TaxID=2755323 RepID=A0A7V8VCT9_9BACT|nr:hypothetical protein [Thermogemmata fonticola]MBA2225677.1 hypothetical protein [Thermogemmata fonticola]MCX8139783.1 hypothetical protein [Gemmataceae bacterium]
MSFQRGVVPGVMGELSLLLPQSLPPQAQAVLSHAAFAVSYDLSLIPIPLPSRAVLQDGCLKLQHNFQESGHVLVPWKVSAADCRVLESASLCSRLHPYRLLLELARGELHQLRQYVEDWTAIGVQLPDSFSGSLRNTTRLFVSALGAEEQQQDQLSAAVLEQCSHLSDALVREFTQQMLETRLQKAGQLSTRLAAQSAEPWGATLADYQRSCNAAHVAIRWRQVEPAEGRWRWEIWDEALHEALAAGMPITAGPLIDLSLEALPEWLLVHRDDWPTLAALMCDYVESAIQRYRSSIRRWVILAGFNLSDPLGLDEDQRLRLAHRLLRAAQQVDPDLEISIRLAQPWGDYLSMHPSAIAPLVFADDLLRGGAQLATLDLEIRFGPLPRASWPRDLLDTFRLFDLYGILGIPLSVTLAVPAALPSDMPSETPSVHLCSWIGSEWGPSQQAEWGAALTALALSLPTVQAVTWESWQGSPSSTFPPLGLLDAHGQPQPLWQHWCQLRRRYLQ